MSSRSKGWDNRRIYKFIEAHSEEYDIKTMCRVLDVARAGYYAWLRKPLSDRAIEDARLLRLIRASYNASQGVYGSTRIFLDFGKLANVQQAPRRTDHASEQDQSASWSSNAPLNRREALRSCARSGQAKL